MKRVTITCLALAAILSTAASAQPASDSKPHSTGTAVNVGVAPTIQELMRLVPQPTSFGAPVDVPNRTVPRFLLDRPIVHTESDPLAGPLPTRRAPGALLSFEGYNNNDNNNLVGGLVAPPDVNGDVGRDFYVQYMNLGWIIFNKSDGSVAAGPFVGNLFWQAPGFNGVCRTQNAGDPIVLYDHIAERWVFSQFTSPNNPDGHQCFAISQGSDPQGPYFLYDFVVSPGEFNDYPKIGLWTDGAGQSAYHMMTNQFGASFTAVQVTAFERDAMLAGNNAQQVNFRLPASQTPQRFALQPAHLEGPTPPSGSCAPYVQALDIQTFGGSGPDGYQFWRFCTDWNNTNNSTFGTTSFVSTAAFDAELCGFSRDCIQQPSTTQNLDALGQFTMYRFANRMVNGNHKAVINHTVDTGGNIAGIRWAEFDINSATGSASLADTGTLAPGDGDSRWVGSVALDSSGNLGLSYTRSSNSTFPGVFFTGRETGDPAGTLQAESACVIGTGSQLGINRWVDYSSISVDPVDGCTFWMTNEYVETTGTRNWTTRVCSFRFPSCGAPINTAPSVNISAPANGATFNDGDSVSFTGTATDAEDGNISGSLSWTSSIDGNIGSGGSFSTSTLSVGNHTITASVTDSGGLSGSDAISITVQSVGGGGCSLETDFETGGLNGWTNLGTSTCSTGTYVVATPTLQTNGGVTTQVGGDNTTGSGNALFTATNISAGNADVDGGNCIVQSPSVSVTQDSTLEFFYFHGQRDAGDDAAGDFFSVDVSTNGGGSFTSAVSFGDVQNNAAWTQVTVPVAAGSNVVIRVQTSDGAGPGDLVEGGIDDVSICSTGGGNTAPTVNITAPADGTSVNAGDSVTFSGTANDAEDGNISGSLSWTSSIDGNIGSGASFSTSTLSVGNHTITASATDSDGASDSDSISLTVASVGGGCTVEEDFESGNGGWTNSGASTCSTGAFVVNTPTQQTNGGVTTQVGGDNTTGNGNAFFTATNISAGNADVDGGTCIALSPVFSVTSASTLDLAYFHGQRDAGDDPGGDFFTIEVSTDGGSTFGTSVVSFGDVQNNAVWTNATAQIPAGSNVQIRVSAADGAGPGDLVEGGIDDVSICSN